METKIQIPHKFLCRDYQIPAWEALKEGKKRIVCCWHRGAGKDLFALNFLIWKALQKPAVYLHCFPKYNQGKRAIWQSVHETGKGDSVGYLDHFPKELIKHKNSSDMCLELVNGSFYYVMGIDGKNADVARGLNPSFVILSEYAYMDPHSWYTIEPRVSLNNGTALFLSTPNGQNHFYNLYNYAKQTSDPDYFASLLTIDDTSVFNSNFIEDKRKAAIPEDFIQQEYYCSFTRGAEGSYYGKQVQEARDDNRITFLKMKDSLPVHTAWDIGYSDSTSIWFFQIFPSGQMHFLDYYENHGMGLPHFIQHLEQWKVKNKCVWGRHFVPFDMGHHEYSSGMERTQIARELGYEMTIVPKHSLPDGIQAVRSAFSDCSFHSICCKRGVECLDFYRKKWNDHLKIYYDEPQHDQYSHGCFIETTKISTNHGLKNIKDICVNDMVKTPSGYRRVTEVFKYQANKILKISTSKGASIQCTPNHKIFTETKLAYADALCYTDTLIDESNSGNIICKKYIGCHGEKKNLGFRDYFLLMNQERKLSSTDIHTRGMVFITKVEELGDCIAKYGNFLKDLFRETITSIISIKILEIMTFQTYYALNPQSICSLALRPINGLEVKPIKNNCEKTAKNFENGINQTKESYGTLNTEKNLGSTESGIKSNVKFVEKKKKHHTLHRQNYVHQNVEQNDVLKVALTTLNDCVLFVLKNLKSISIKNKEHVQEIVVQHLDEPIDVYDFEVEHDHCYYANGLLVSNSDAFRYAIAGVKKFGGHSTRLNADSIKEMRLKNLGY